jgi:hypothetical protein
MLLATGAAPHNFSFRRVQLKTVAGHVACDVINDVRDVSIMRTYALSR